jgi:hypothetical protein
MVFKEQNGVIGLIMLILLNSMLLFYLLEMILISILKKLFNGLLMKEKDYRNFILGWIDTPDQNMPFVIEHDHLEFIFTILEKISRSTSDMIVGEAVNMRLQTKNLSLPEVIAEASRRGMSFNELLAVREEDKWVYSNGPNLVCSAFVIAFYKAGGLFDGMDVQATEFGPKDIYQLDIFDKEYKRPNECVLADPDLPYCQIMGNLKIDLPGYSTIKPYSHMNEKCPSVGPEFRRLEGC